MAVPSAIRLYRDDRVNIYTDRVTLVFCHSVEQVRRPVASRETILCLRELEIGAQVERVFEPVRITYSIDFEIELSILIRSNTNLDQCYPTMHFRSRKEEGKVYRNIRSKSVLIMHDLTSLDTPSILL